MTFTKTFIPGVFVIEPKVFGDARGYFFESFNQREFEEHIGNISFVQDNESRSARGVLRGLHFQRPPYAQAKLVRCIEGEVLDVAVDLRQGSPTFKKYVAVNLSGNNKKQLFIPRGFAHGFVVLSEMATFAYKVDNVYAPDYDGGIVWNDPEINVNWQMTDTQVLLSAKDNALKPLSATEIPFTN